MIAAIDLGGTRTKYGLVEEGRVVAAEVCHAQPGKSIAIHLQDIGESLRQLCLKSGTTLESCKGIGLLSTGLVDNRRMKVLSTNRKYEDAVRFDFRGWAAGLAGLELRLENDARGALIGEWRYGAGRGVGNLFMVTIGTGIGTAAIVEGRPLTGPHFSGGNLGGHIVVRSGGRACTCGGRGCLEAEASGWALPEVLREHSGYAESSLKNVDPVGFKELRDHAIAGDACARDIQDRFYQLWGEALVSYIHLLDPERMIVGGGIMHEPVEVLERFREIVRELAWTEEGHVEIVAASHPDHAGLIGAAALFDGP